MRYKGTKTVAITPDYAEVAKLSDEWLNPKQGTDAALAHGHGPRDPQGIPRRQPQRRTSPTTCAAIPTCRTWSCWNQREDGRYVPGRFLRASDLSTDWARDNNPEWKTIAIDETDDSLTAPNGSIGYRWGEKGKWNLQQAAGAEQQNVKLRLSLADEPRRGGQGRLSLFRRHRSMNTSTMSSCSDTLTHHLGARKVTLAERRRSAGGHRLST